ncbi:MAG: hypothetical protein KDK65_04640, partial [Chlamydiia bacterium]|nr:hypothetical protein [Chlamydiia bacterium]
LDQISKMTETQLVGVHNQVSIDHWNKLVDNITGEQIEKFATQKGIDLLTVGQLAHITITQVKFLKTAQQIAACPVAYIEELQRDQLAHATLDQISKMTETQLVGVRNRVGDRWKLLVDNITGEQIAQMGHEGIALLKPEQIRAHLKKDQVGLLATDAHIGACPLDFVPYLEPRQLRAMTEDLLPHATPEQLVMIKGKVGDDKWTALRQNISQTQVEKMRTQSQVNLLDADQVHKWLTQHNLNCLKSVEQIQACPDGLVKKLNRSQLSKIKKEQVPFLSTEQLKNLKQIKRDKWDEWSQAISEKQVHAFTNKEELKMVSQEHITNYLLKRQIALLDERWQVRAIAKELLEHIDTSTQLLFLTKKQITQLSKQEQIRALKFRKVQHLTHKQLQKRSWGQFLTYTFAVFTLGTVGSALTLTAHLTLIPLGTYLISKKHGCRLMKRLHANPKRLFRYLKVYTTSAPAA